jgi:hypothetical protein
MTMSRIVLISLLGTVLTWGSGPVVADPMRGPIQVMRPDGTTFRIASPSADSWWKEYLRARCVSCSGPRQAALLLGRVESALGTRFRAGHRYLLAPESLQLNWPRAWLFYPSTDRTPAYVVRHGGVGAGDSVRWDVWIPATPRMEEMIVEGTDETSSPRATGPRPDTGRSASVPLVPWVVILAIAGVFAIASWLYSLTRRGRHARGRKAAQARAPVEPEV